MADMVIELLSRQRKRLVASSLNAAEKSAWWPKLTERERTEFRDKLISSIGVYHDFMLDVVRVSAETSQVNEHALDLIQQIHSNQARMTATVSQLARGTA